MGGFGMGYGGAVAALAEVGVRAAAAGDEVGELFQYAITQPVSIGRQQSAMIPIVNQSLEGEKISIFTESVHPIHPMNGLQVKNTAGLHLMGGPITVFDAGTYAGDALVTDLRPGEERFIAYAVDLGVEVAVEREHERRQDALKIDQGVLNVTVRSHQTVTCALMNRTAEQRTVLVEQEKETDWSLIEPQQPTEDTRSMYRFAVELTPKAAENLVVRTQRPLTETVALLDPENEQAIAFYLQSDVISDQVKAGLQEIIRRRVEIAGVASEKAQRQRRLEEIGVEQDRIRKNMAQLGRDSDLYKTYVAKLTAQEDEFDRMRAEIAQFEEREQRLSVELNEYIRELNVE